MSYKREFLHGYSPIVSVQLFVCINIGCCKKFKDWKMMGGKSELLIFYILRHARTIAPVIIRPMRAVTGERGIEEGLLSSTGDRVTTAPSLKVT
jgi:hypothetical protein